MVIMERQKRADTRFDQLHHLIEQLRHHAPDWADRLSNATTDREFLDVLCKLFDLSSTTIPRHREPRSSDDLAGRIATFISKTLHQGPTLKTLAEWLGYSEKYCSELFRSVMGEPFSRYLARRRTEIASDLLLTTDKSIGDIAASVGFSDQFSFSHFFKRTTGFSPRAFRATHARRQPSSTTKPQQSPSQ
jgi:AraC-like DNA-binding protein